jgi:hypothetical protein
MASLGSLYLAVTSNFAEPAQNYAERPLRLNAVRT